MAASKNCDKLSWVFNAVNAPGQAQTVDDERHEGALAMAEETFRSSAIRLRPVPLGIRQERRGEIELMYGLRPGMADGQGGLLRPVAPAVRASPERRYGPQ